MCELRERASLYGPEALTDNELLSLIMGHRKEKDYGEIINRTCTELKEKGLTEVEVLKALSILEFARRLYTKVEERQKIRGVEDIVSLSADLKPLDKEHFRLFYLNGAGRLIGREDITVGTPSSCPVSLSEVLKKVLRSGAASLVAVHNHPSGEASPSTEDNAVTKGLKTGCEAVGIRFADHVIVSKYGYYSYCESGKI